MRGCGDGFGRGVVAFARGLIACPRFRQSFPSSRANLHTRSPFSPRASIPLVIENTGPVVRSTSFWESSFAKAGGLYCSANAGVIRLLVPRQHERFIPEMQSGYEVLVTQGRSEYTQKPDSLELLWEDGSDAPFSVQLGARQHDGAIDSLSVGHRIHCHAYIRGFRGTPQLVGVWPARLRTAPSLPCLKPWGES